MFFKGDKMNYIEKTGLLSGYDPQSKVVTLSYVLRTLMSAFAKVNNRVVGDNLRFFGRTRIPPSASDSVSCRFLLPKDAKNVMLWYPGYKLVPNGASDQLAFDLKAIKENAPGKVMFTREDGNVYLLTAEHPLKRIEGDYYFYIVYYEVNGVAKNGYLSFFAEHIDDQDKCAQIRTLCEYIKYLSSGNPNYGEFFTVFEPKEGSLVEKVRIPNRPLTTPTLTVFGKASDWLEIDVKILSLRESNFRRHLLEEEALCRQNDNRQMPSDSELDEIIIPMVNRTETKSRRGGETIVNYEIAFASELNASIPCLLSYIRAIHASGFFTLPGVFGKDNHWSLVVRDVVPSSDSFRLNDFKPLITICSHEATSGRRLDRIPVEHSNIDRLLFGTNAKWLISVVERTDDFKSPGNGGLLQYLCGKCSDADKLRMVCSSLANVVDGVHNDFIGKSTAELENTMISDANFVRSQAEVAFSYKQLTGIDTTVAYYQNYAELLRLLASLRSLGGDYFVGILQQPLSFTGKRQNAEGKQDSTKLMAIFNDSKINGNKPGPDGKISMLSKADGGIFYVLRREFIDDDNRSVLCPYSREMLEIAEINGMFSSHGHHGMEMFTPLTLVSSNSHQISLAGLNQHTSLNVQFTSDGTPFPEKAIPFKGNPEQLAKMSSLRYHTLRYMRSSRFLEKLETLVVSNGEYKVACSLARLLAERQGKPTDIYHLLPYDANVDDITGKCSQCQNPSCSCVERRVPRLYTNFVANCSRAYRNGRFSYLWSDGLTDLLTDQRQLSFLDKINGFLLAGEWKKPNFHQHLALVASVLHANCGETEINNCPPPFTEAIWLNFGLPETMVADNGDLLLRTLNPCLSFRTNCVQMLLNAKKWLFVLGNVPKTESPGRSIGSQRRPDIKSSRDTHDASRALAGYGNCKQFIVAIGGRMSFIDNLRQEIFSGQAGAYVRKPQVRQLIMRLLSEPNCEWKSLLSLSLSRNEERHISLGEYLYRINTQLPKSFIIDGKTYRTEQYRARIVNEFLDAL